MELLLNDVRIGARTLARTPGFASIGILIMALGIGATVAMFAIVRSVLLNPLPYADPSQLVRLYESMSLSGLDIPYGASAGGTFAEWQQRNHTLSDIAISGVMEPGVTPSQAAADLTLITGRIHDEHLDDSFVAFGATSRPLLDSIVGRTKTLLYALLAATCCVLLIACLNVANLLVARTAARRKEQAIRAALGGGKLRLLRQHLMESLLICIAGGAIGFSLAVGVLRWFVAMRHDVPRVESIAIDGVVVAFTVGLVFLCAAFAGAISSFLMRGDHVLQSLRGQSPGVARTRLRSVLLSLEVGLTVVLLIGAGLLLKSYTLLRSSDLGCVTNNVLTMDLSLPTADYKEPASVADFFASFLDRVRTLRGIRAAGMTYPVVPGNGQGTNDGFVITEHPPLPLGKQNIANNRWCDAGYFAALGIPFLEGHNFSSSQRPGHSTEIIISESLARQFFPGEDPIGKHNDHFQPNGFTDRRRRRRHAHRSRRACTFHDVLSDPRCRKHYPFRLSCDSLVRRCDAVRAAHSTPSREHGPQSGRFQCVDDGPTSGTEHTRSQL